MSDKVIVSIEGNIGVGKSTFIKILKSKWNKFDEDEDNPNNTGCEIVLEPVDMWKELVGDDGKNILQTFYEDIPRWAYSFQNVACITRMMKIENTIRQSPHKYIFLDRSLGTDKNVFEAMLHDDGKINMIEHSMYNLWCNFYNEYVRSLNDQVYIYLKASPKTCLNRIKTRGRVEEETIPLEYLENLNKYHDKWLLSEEMTENVIIIDCDEDFERDENKHDQMILEIKSRLSNIIFKKNTRNFEIYKKNMDELFAKKNNIYVRNNKENEENEENEENKENEDNNDDEISVYSSDMSDPEMPNYNEYSEKGEKILMIDEDGKTFEADCVIN